MSPVSNSQRVLGKHLRGAVLVLVAVGRGFLKWRWLVGCTLLTHVWSTGGCGFAADVTALGSFPFV